MEYGKRDAYCVWRKGYDNCEHHILPDVLIDIELTTNPIWATVHTASMRHSNLLDIPQFAETICHDHVALVRLPNMFPHTADKVIYTETNTTPTRSFLKISIGPDRRGLVSTPRSRDMKQQYMISMVIDPTWTTIRTANIRDSGVLHIPRFAETI